MPSAYLIVLYNEIGDPRGLDQYAALARPRDRRRVGRSSQRGYRRVHMKRVGQIFEFWCALTGVEAAVALYESAEYRESLNVLGELNIRDVRGHVTIRQSENFRQRYAATS